MKKLLTITLTIIIFVFTLSGCTAGSNPMESATNEIFTAIQNGDTEYLSKLYSRLDKEGHITINQDSYLTYDEFLDMDFSSYYDIYGKNLSYKITDIDEDNLTVTVDVTYLDGHDIYDQIILNELNGLLTDSDEDTINDDLFKDIDTSNTNTETIELQFRDSDSDYILDTMTDELFNVVTCGIYDPILDFFLTDID